ncbi:MAG: hypothetical protein DI598_16005 [Pseudopedobacter saltans]|uniref:Uncharacterized protein n=1 Tax=Pseudopedobacter saltans TaxID=151895 RepID=A0A2W5ENQ2_9SPHI|nr:MAG: hypothetical protein DI598_16005 [Pseudopedobacter saltans]
MQKIKSCPLKLLIIGLCFFHFQLLHAQSSLRTNSSVETEYNQARDYYQKGQRSLAYPIFKSLYYNSSIKRNSTGLSPNTKANIRYYTLETGLSLDDSTMLKDAKEFAEETIDPVRSQMMCFHLGEYYYRRQKFLEAIKFYSKGGFSNLSKEDMATAKFHKGYAYFQIGDRVSASPLLYAVSNSEKDSNYYDANYYYGFIALDEKDYEQSLKCFQTVENVPRYKSMVPYYITEVYYFSGDLNKAISYGRSSLSNNGKLFLANDLQLLIGRSYFEKSDFEKALPFLRNYADVTPSVQREDQYKLAYCYYQNKEFQNAVNGFSSIVDSTSRDSVYQNSLYFLASSYLWLGDKKKAQSAYYECAKIMDNVSQKENAFFNYIKLSYSLGENDTALSALNQFNTLFPNSTNSQDAQDLNVILLADNKKYKEAYKMIMDMGTPSSAIQQVYPSIMLGYSLDLINEEKYSAAKDVLVDITNAPYNEKEKQVTYFYLGKVFYSLGQYDTSVMAISAYLNKPVVQGDANIENAYYTLGYDYLNVKDYHNALIFFRKVATNINSSSNELAMDAFRRQGDCYYVTREYAKALYIYNALIKNNYSNIEYCYSQKGQIAKAQGNQEEAITNYQLAEKSMAENKPSSDIQYELATTYMSQGDYAKAVTPLQAIVKRSYISDSLYANAYLSLGVCQYNLNNYNQAQDAFERVVLKFPNTDQAKTSNEYLKLVYGNLNRPEAFVKVNKRIGQNISEGAQDTLYYQTATNLYESKKWSEAKEAYQKYIDKYPNGSKVLDSKFYIANILFQKNKDTSNSIPYYQYIVDHLPNNYQEDALYNLAKINYFKLKDYDNALSQFSQLKMLTSDLAIKLECIKASIRIQFKLNRWENAYTNANELLNYKDIKPDDKQMAYLIIGKNLENEKKLDEAMSNYNKVVALGNSVFSAEAQYHVAEIFFKQNKLNDAEKTAFGVQKIGVSDYWIEKSYILLGEIYFEKKDYFNANATLKSIVDNSTDATLKKEAQTILDKVVKASPSQETQTNN